MTRPKPQVVIAAHRGMAAGYPENTLAAFRHSVSAGFPVIEVDLRATADGHIVIMHDETVDRTLRGLGATLILDIKQGAMLDNEHVVRLAEQHGEDPAAIEEFAQAGADLPELLRDVLAAERRP